MLVTLKDVLKIAEAKKLAVGAFNTPNLESLTAVLEAAAAKAISAPARIPRSSIL